MKKFKFLILTISCLFVNGSFSMDLKEKDAFSVSVNVINKNFRQLPNDADAVNLLIVSDNNTIKDIVPIPSINTSYTFYISPICSSKGLIIQLGQIDNSHEGIHSEIYAMQVFNKSTCLSDNFTITIEGFLGQPSFNFILTSKCERGLLRSIHCRVLDLLLKLLSVNGNLSADKSTPLLENLVLLSVVLHKSHPPIFVKSNKDLYIEYSGPSSESYKMLSKHETFKAW